MVHGSYESDVAAATTPRIVIALAGPVVSLLVGLLFLTVPSRGSGWLRLLWTWLGLLGVELFFGYLLTAPFFATGDIGLTLHLLGAPRAVGFVVAAAGVVGIVGLGWLAWCSDDGQRTAVDPEAAAADEYRVGLRPSNNGSPALRGPQAHLQPHRPGAQSRAKALTR